MILHCCLKDTVIELLFFGVLFIVFFTQLTLIFDRFICF